MTRDDIIRMAREARLVPKWLELCPKDEKALVRFAALVAAAESEACAQIADAEASIEGIAQRIAVNIRARGNT